jgi:hypothetical protein
VIKEKEQKQKRSNVLPFSLFIFCVERKKESILQGEGRRKRKWRGTSWREKKRRRGEEERKKKAGSVIYPSIQKAGDYSTSNYPHDSLKPDQPPPSSSSS